MLGIVIGFLFEAAPVSEVAHGTLLVFAIRWRSVSRLLLVVGEASPRNLGPPAPAQSTNADSTRQILVAHPSVGA